MEGYIILSPFDNTQKVTEPFWSVDINVCRFPFLYEEFWYALKDDRLLHVVVVSAEPDDILYEHNFMIVYTGMFHTLSRKLTCRKNRNLLQVKYQILTGTYGRISVVGYGEVNRST